MAGGCTWQGVCVAGGVHGRGACMVEGCVAGGCGGGGHAWHPVNERPVRILLECILVLMFFKKRTKLFAHRQTF